jgi:hypothetical protein
MNRLRGHIWILYGNEWLMMQRAFKKFGTTTEKRLKSTISAERKKEELDVYISRKQS